MWAHVSQFPVDCTVETCQLFVKGAVWGALIPNYPRVNALDKMTYLKRYIHFMKLFCGAVHLHPLLLSNTNSKHSAISRTACKAMEAEHGLHKGDSGLGNHQFWVPWVDTILGPLPVDALVVPITSKFYIDIVSHSIPSNHFWNLKRASSKVRCSCLEARIETSPAQQLLPCIWKRWHSYDGYFTGWWFPPKGGSPWVCHQAIFVQRKWAIHQALVSQHYKSYCYSWNYEHHTKAMCTRMMLDCQTKMTETWKAFYVQVVGASSHRL